MCKPVCWWWRHLMRLACADWGGTDLFGVQPKSLDLLQWVRSMVAQLQANIDTKGQPSLFFLNTTFILCQHSLNHLVYQHITFRSGSTIYQTLKFLYVNLTNVCLSDAPAHLLSPPCFLLVAMNFAHVGRELFNSLRPFPISIFHPLPRYAELPPTFIALLSFHNLLNCFYE